MILVDDQQQFDVVGIDPDGNQVDLPMTPTWSAELGEITAEGLYTATAEGDEVVTVVVPRQMSGQGYGKGVLAMEQPPWMTDLIFEVDTRPTDPDTTETSASEDQGESGQDDESAATENFDIDIDEDIKEPIVTDDEAGDVSEDEKSDSFYQPYDDAIANCIGAVGVAAAAGGTLFYISKKRKKRQ